MSPAPHGNLQVERYIGSCLISSRSKHQQLPQYPVKARRDHHDGRFHSEQPVPARGDGGPRYPLPLPGDYPANYRPHGPPAGWAGVPLISMSPPRRNRKNCAQGGLHGDDSKQQGLDQGRSPFSRLAIHTQGAPLIQAGRYNANRRVYNRGPPAKALPQSRPEAPRVCKDGARGKEPPSTNSDSLSVASDESSGNSENALPRIIKPRKRRKKDRKPPVAETSSQPDTAGRQTPVDSAPPSPKHFTSCYELRQLEQPEQAKQEEGRKSVDSDAQSAVKEAESAKQEVPWCVPVTVCQCRYCDPVGVIWDVDQRCYSPFLTPPSPSDKPQYQASLLYNPPVRRSWSEPSWSEPSVHTPEGYDSSQSLHVSSEIITSPNGHRDIEIKFFSLPTKAWSGSEAQPPPPHRHLDVEE